MEKGFEAKECHTDQLDIEGTKTVNVYNQREKESNNWRAVVYDEAVSHVIVFSPPRASIYYF
jgi:hypothetical protein